MKCVAAKAKRMRPEARRNCAVVGRQWTAGAEWLASRVVAIGIPHRDCHSVRMAAEFAASFAQFKRGAAQAIGKDPHDLDRHFGKFGEEPDELVLLDAQG